MYIMSAKMMGKILSNLDEGIADKRQVDFQFKMHRDAMKFHTDNINIQPTDENYKEATEHIQDSLGVIVDIDTTKMVLSLFPTARIKLAKYEGCGDTEVRELISGAFCVYFTGSEVPTYGDKIDTDRFYDHLQKQAEIMGFKST